MAGINKAIIVGRLGRDPEVRYTPDGTAVANFSLATSEEWKDKQTGEKREKTEWHRVVFFGKQAETIGRYMTKGRQMYVEGRLQTSSYEKDGITRYSTDIIANDAATAIAQFANVTGMAQTTVGAVTALPTMPSGARRSQRPRVKSGNSTGRLPLATERSESSHTTLHAAPS